MSVEIGSSIGSISSEIGSAATAEISPSFPSPSFLAESKSFSPELANGIPRVGEIFNSVPSISSLEDGGAFSHNNPFDIQSSTRPVQLDLFPASANIASESNDKSALASLRSYDVLSHAENVLAETQAIEAQPDEFSGITDAVGDILREARVK